MGQECCTNKGPLEEEHELPVSDVRLDEKAKSAAEITPNGPILDPILETVDPKLVEAEEKVVEEQRKQQEWLNREEEAVEKEKQAKDQQADLHALIHLFQKCVHFYKDHDIDTAIDIAKQIQAEKTSIKEQRGLDQTNFLSLLRSAEQAWQKSNPEHKIQPYSLAFIQSLQAEMKEVLYYLNAVYKQPFIEKCNQDGVKISTRRQANTVGAMIDCQLHVPFEHFASILTEIDYYYDFLPYCEQSTMIKDIDRNNKIGYVLLDPPLIAKRQAYFQGYAYFRLKKTKDIFIYTRSIHNNPELQKLFEIETPLNKKYVPLDYKYFVLKYQPISEGVGSLKFAFNIDNGVHFLPQFIHDYITREFSKKFFNNIMNICKKFKGSKWEKRMTEKPGFTVYLKEQIRDFLENKRKEQDANK